MERSPSSTFQRGKPSSESPMLSHACMNLHRWPCWQSACKSGGRCPASDGRRRCCHTGSRDCLQRTCSSTSRLLQLATWVRAKPPLPLLTSTCPDEGLGPNDRQQRLTMPEAALAIQSPLLCIHYQMASGASLQGLPGHSLHCRYLDKRPEAQDQPAECPGKLAPPLAVCSRPRAVGLAKLLRVHL